MKEGIVNEIWRLEKSLQDILPRLDSIDSMLILMAYVEVLDNEANAFARMRIDDEALAGIEADIVLRHIIQKKQITKEAVFYLYSKSNNRRTLARIPPLVSFFSMGDLSIINPEKHPGLNKWLRKNYDPRLDEGIIIPVKLLSTFDGTRILVFKGFHKIMGKESILLTMNFLHVFHMKMALQHLLDRGIEATISSDGSKVTLENLTPEQILEWEDVHPRKFHSGGADRFPYWTKEVLDGREDSIRSTRLVATSPEQKQSLANEHRTYFRQYAALAGFSEAFQKETQISMDDYSEITLAFERLSLEHDPPAVFMPKNKVLRKIKQRCHSSEKDILKVMAMFTCNPDEVNREKAIFTDGTSYFFTWSMIVGPFHDLVDDIYHDFVDGNVQGLKFEKECRSILSKNSYSVYGDRLLINRQILPTEVSMRLWGRIKNRTDLDVIGARGNYLIVLECKSEIQRKVRSETQLNRLKKHHEELQHKALWISNNFDEFRNILKSNNFQLPDEISCVVPILVGAFIEPYKHSTTISMAELDKIQERIPLKLLSERIEIRLEGDIEIVLPVYEIRNRITRTGDLQSDLS